MTFIQAWNATFAWSITAGCFIVAVVAAARALRSRGLYRWTPVIACLVMLWVGGLGLFFWVVQSVSIPPEYLRPSIFALVAIVLALVLGYRRFDA